MAETVWLIGQRGTTLVLTENRTGKLRAFETEDDAAFFIAGLPNPESLEPREVEVQDDEEDIPRKLDEAANLLIEVHAITSDIWCDEMSDLNFRHLQDCLAGHARKLAKMSKRIEGLLQSLQELEGETTP